MTKTKKFKALEHLIIRICFGFRYSIFKFKKRAQTSMELTVALVLVMILIVGAAKMFAWLNSRMVQRAEDYEITRVEAGSAVPAGGAAALDLSWKDETDVSSLVLDGEYTVDESGYEKLNVFKKQE